MKEMPENSVDSIVTDPPYELGFMGKSWDSSGIAFNLEVWQEALRVLKPGGHLIAFSGSRTYHRMAVAIEDAGFEIRDQIMWVYGSGFPKSHNVSKGIDKAAERDVRELSDAAKQWDGWGTALKPAHEPIVMARKPLIGTVANNVLTYGTGGLNIDASRVEGAPPSVPQPSLRPQGFDSGHALGTGEGRNGKMSQATGRFPANFIHDGSDEVVALFPDTGKSGVAVRRNGNNAKGMFPVAIAEGSADVGFNDSGSAARFFYCAKASKRDRNEGLEGFELKNNSKIMRLANNTSDEVAEGFERFQTQPAANFHPTVKPTTLMQYLVRLVTPPNGTVLDPFMGSGSTGKACAYEGFDFIGIDQSAEYVEIARARIEYVNTAIIPKDN
jgi:site-specific DNA-methyltransferase (adenine-specific)